MKSIVLLMTVITVCVIHTEARPRGAPSSTCSDFLPRHLANQATGPVPYVVNVSSIGASYSGGQTYPIMICGTSTDTDFRGFLIQATTCADGTPVGMFMEPSAGSDANYKTVCSGSSSATHTSRTDKTCVELMWIAPSSGTGCIRFRYTMVDIHRRSQNQSRYWDNEMTDTIQEEEPCLVKGQIKKDCAADPSCQTTCVSRFNFGIVCPEICAIAEVNSTQQPLTLCECPDGMIIDEDKNECVTPSDCTPMECPIDGQVFGDCVALATCDDPDIPAICDFPRCVCDDGLVLDELVNACVNLTDCSNVCEVSQIRGRVNKRRRTATLRFSVVDDTATTLCRLDRGDFERCTSPKSYRALSQGKHTITVRARCPGSNDRMTKKFGFRIR
ncbi:uncharacterized protein [Dysidea avara]|uniref:uncharacterized protein isoform X1 n=1 Tax=Dysidea avara TaxID=196820 RepID=UPI00331E3641